MGRGVGCPVNFLLLDWPVDKGMREPYYAESRDG